MSDIKEAASYESVTEQYAPQKPTEVDNGDIVEMMEKEWPEMTSEFKRFSMNNMNYSVTNNMTMVQVIYLLVHNYRHQKK